MRHIEQLLTVHRRSLSHDPYVVLLGPTGKRLWAEALEPVPGFRGAIDVIHKMNLPLLFTIENDFAPVCEPVQCVWRPDRLTQEWHRSGLSFQEKKYITWEDCAVSHMMWRNLTGGAVVLRLRLPERTVVDSPHGYQIQMAHAASHPELFTGMTLADGDTIEISAACAVGIVGDQGEAELGNLANTWAKRPPVESLEAHHDAYYRFFDEAPCLQSDDPLLEKTWAYRWFLLRHNLMRPGIGHLQHAFFSEGRSHKMGKTPYAPTGWEFSKLIPLSVPMHLVDMRWHGNASFLADVVETMLDNQDAQGLFRCAYVDRHLAAYSNFFGWAVYQAVLAHGNLALARRALPALKRQVQGWQTAYGRQRDALMVETVHQLTGKEYQPGYWAFTGYPDDPTDPAGVTPLARVDKSVYHLQNVRGVAALCHLLGDPQAGAYDKLAVSIATDINAKMWDGSTTFYHDLHHQTDEKAPDKHVVGFYPYWADGVGDAHPEGLTHLFGPDFATRCPFPSVATDSALYAPAGGWKGYFFKGRNGCVWNGPTWPYTNAVLLDALGSQSLRSGHRYDAAFADFFRAYSFLHYEGRNLDRPGLVEHYNSQTGEALSGEVDYLHSYWIDLVMRYLAGLQPDTEALHVSPLAMGLTSFSIEGIPFRGRRVDIQHEKGTHIVEVDGRRVAELAPGAQASIPIPMQA